MSTPDCETPAGSAAGGPFIGTLLRTPAAAVTARLAEAFAHDFPELRRAHLTVFQHIDHPPRGTRLTTLAERSELTKQSLIELVDYLDRTGYVERLVDPADRRAKLIRLTDRGWRVHERAGEVVAELQEEWAEAFGAERLLELMSLLGELCHCLGLKTSGHD